MKNNQREIIGQEVIETIRRHAINSVLDIGAGQGDLALRISSSVIRYLAIESDYQRVELLKKVGLETRYERFPDGSFDECFDLVLSSHSIPEDLRLYNKFLTKLWEYTKSDGVCKIVTFKGAKDDLARLRKQFRSRDWIDEDLEKYNMLVNILKSLGDYEQHTITSVTTTESRDELIKLLTFSIGGSDVEKKSYVSDLEKLIDSHYFNEITHLYEFPHQHLVFDLYK